MMAAGKKTCGHFGKFSKNGTEKVLILELIYSLHCLNKLLLLIKS